MNEFVIAGGTVVTPHELLAADVLVRGGKIAAVAPEVRAGGAEIIDAAGRLVAPGCIDVHIQGHEGRDFWEGTVEAANAVAASLPRHGVTGIAATTDGAPELIAPLAEAIDSGTDGAEILGIHSEGPFISPGRPGAIEAEKIRAVDMDLLARILEAGRGHVRIVTIAPEVPGALEAISLLAAEGVAASLGHSQASFEEAERGFEAGARRVTHLFNAMTGFADRADGGLAAAAILRDDVGLEVVSDLVHVHPAIIRMVLAAAGARRTAAITDSVKVAGMEPGRYTSGGHGKEVFVEEDGQPPRLADGTIAGSSLSVDRAIRNLVHSAGVSMSDAFTMAAYAPAAALGLVGEKGEIAPGRAADIVIWTDELEVKRTFVGGRERFAA